MRFLLFSFILLCSSTLSFAQVTPTPADERRQAFSQRQLLQEDSPVRGLRFTSIGPSIMSGRVTDVAVDPDSPSHFYVAYASGGLWETKDNGTTFSPLFDDQSVMTIGDIDVHWASGTIYVGTGEVNSSRSSYAGDGVYRSTDGGKNWQHLGLEESHHIGRLVVDQEDLDRVWVAALGHLYGPNPERGVYRTTDGGKNWTKTLYVDENSGAVDLIRDPQNPDELYAATWQRERKAWNFVESGPGSGIYHSTDGGANWRKLSTGGSGFPVGEGAGRIGLAISYDEAGQRHLYASIDNYFRREAEEEDEETLTKNRLRTMPKEEVLRLKNYLLDDFLRTNGFPRELDAKTLRAKIESGEVTPLQLVEYLEDANSLLFDTPVKGFELYHSTDGDRWQRTHEDYLDGVYSSYGYYFGQIAVHSERPETIYAMGVPIVKSTDGGKTWAGANGPNVHADHHYMWINPRDPAHLINGNDGGINISYDGGSNWIKCNVPPVGQFYAIAVDNHKEGYRVYGGLQDNGTWRGPHDYESGPGWKQRGEYPYKALFGGDGMQVQVDPRDHETAYVGFQFGNYFRVNPKNGSRKYLTPKHELGERPYRWNWQTPILISPHQPDIFYMGSNHLHRSFNRGDDFAVISPDLTRGGKEGDVAFGTLTTIDESPLRFGLLYVGSDDGLVHRSEDGGANWKPLNTGLPTDLWVTGVMASQHEEDVVYLALNGYRNDDFTSYVYRSTDRGDHWTRIGLDLPAEPVNVVYEDPLNAALLYVGTDHGLYVSTDTGATFTATFDLPAVAVHDAVVQKQKKHLVVGTHGRSLYRANVSVLQAIAGKDEPVLTLMQPEDQRYSSRYGSQSWYRDDTAPEVALHVYSPAADADARLTIMASDSTVLKEMPVVLTRGINELTYDLSFDEARAAALEELLNEDRGEDKKPIRVKAADDGDYYLRAGKYKLTLSTADQEATTTLTVK